MKIIDVIGIVLVVVGILITVANLFATHRPIADMQSFTVQEITPPVDSKSRI